VILRMLIGGMLVLLSLPLLSPLIVGAVITRVIQGVCVLTQRLRPERDRDEASRPR
jgi:hypothetical protein